MVDPRKHKEEQTHKMTQTWPRISPQTPPYRSASLLQRQAQSFQPYLIKPFSYISNPANRNKCCSSTMTSPHLSCRLALGLGGTPCMLRSYWHCNSKSMRNHCRPSSWQGNYHRSRRVQKQQRFWGPPLHEQPQCVRRALCRMWLYSLDTPIPILRL